METLARAANRGSVSTGYDIDNSLKFEPDNSEYLKATNTFAYTTPTSNQKGTISFWIKRTEIGNNVSGKQMYIFASSSGNRYANLGFDEFDNLTVYSGDSSWNNVSPYTYNKFRDTSAWYHIVIRYDTTDSTASNRLRVYSNGTEVSWVVAPNITQNGAMTYSDMNGPTWHSWGTIYAYFTPEKFFAGYLAEAHFVDGQSLAPTEFGEYDSTSGIWKPKAYTGTYGNCGYYLDFADSGNLGDDESGNGFDFDENNITAADQATDTPTNNFCTLNQAAFTLTDATISQGATSFFNTVSSTRTAVATMAVTKGKWYFEYKFISTGGSTYWAAIGFTNAESTSSSLSAGVDSDSSVLLLPNGTPYENNTIGSSNYSYFTTNDIAGVALDVDNGNMYLYKNGTIQNSGNPIFTSIGDFIMPLGTTYSNGCGGYFNFGGFTSYTPASPASDANGYGTFEYAPPSGYYALCTKNLAEYG